MKSIRITFRLSPYHLARGLQTIRQIEPSYKLISLNDLVKTTYFDYMAKMNMNRLDIIPSSIMDEVMSFTNKAARSSITVEELINIKDANQESVPEPELELDFAQIESRVLAYMETKQEDQTKPTKASEFNDPNNTDSSISTITDFSPPKDWKK